MGINPSIVHPDTAKEVIKRLPRTGWNGCFADTIREETTLKPWSHTTALGKTFEEGVKNNKLFDDLE